MKDYSFSYFLGRIFTSLMIIFLICAIFHPVLRSYKQGFADGVQSRIDYEHGK